MQLVHWRQLSPGTLTRTEAGIGDEVLTWNDTWNNNYLYHQKCNDYGEPVVTFSNFSYERLLNICLIKNLFFFSDQREPRGQQQLLLLMAQILESPATFFPVTFITHALHFIDCLLSILLGKMFGLLHRHAQEFFQLGSSWKYEGRAHFYIYKWGHVVRRGRKPIPACFTFSASVFLHLCPSAEPEICHHHLTVLHHSWDGKKMKCVNCLKMRLRKKTFPWELVTKAWWTKQKRTLWTI